MQTSAAAVARATPPPGGSMGSPNEPNHRREPTVRRRRRPRPERDRSDLARAALALGLTVGALLLVSVLLAAVITHFA